MRVPRCLFARNTAVSDRNGRASRFGIASEMQMLHVERQGVLSGHAIWRLLEVKSGGVRTPDH